MQWGALIIGLVASPWTPATTTPPPSASAGADQAEGAAKLVEHRFDHLVLGVSELGPGVDRLEDLTGVRLAPGGEHPQAGTHNALASLGDGGYLELVAPRPDTTAADPQLVSWIAGLEQPTPILWAVSTSDAAATRARLHAAGFATSEPRAGSRHAPDGSVLEWRVFGLSQPSLAAAPFFIEWGAATAHPATTSPTGCRLELLEIVSNDNAEMRRLLAVLGVEARVVDGPRPSLAAELSCPAGPIDLRAPPD